MSLILEALKKSEQQRRLGEAPTLGSPVVATRRRRSLLPVLAILILAAAAAGWWLMRSSRAPATPVAPTSTAAPSANPPAATASKPGVRAPATIMDNRARQDRLQASETARQNVQRGQQEKRAAELANAARATPPAASSATSAAGSAATSIVAPATQKPADAGAAAPMPATPAQESVVTQPAPSSSDKSAAPTPTPTPKDQPAAAGAAVPTIWDLPYATRKDIPAIDLSMHVYSADPKQRFVVIKGDRHVEGDEVGQDLVLKEIRPDGLVLDYKGQRFFFPRSGR